MSWLARFGWMPWMRSVLRHSNAVLLVTLLLVAVGAWGFVELADEVIEGDTQTMDERIMLAMRDPQDVTEPRGPRWLEEAARDVTGLGGMFFLVVLTAAVAGYLALVRKFHAMWLVLIATVSGLGLSLALKASFARPRPQLVPHLSHVYTSSFPSGHAMLSTVVFLTLGALLARLVPRAGVKAYFIVLASGLSVLVGVSRVYLGVHYPTDVLAGWSAGLVWALVCWTVARYLQQRGAVEKDIERTPTHAEGIKAS